MPRFSHSRKRKRTTSLELPNYYANLSGSAKNVRLPAIRRRRSDGELPRSRRLVARTEPPRSRAPPPGAREDNGSPDEWDDRSSGDRGSGRDPATPEEDDIAIVATVQPLLAKDMKTVVQVARRGVASAHRAEDALGEPVEPAKQRLDPVK
eukprot:CAMPEP_0198327400 /NCGR_PEP_ID=MMETSP1450-20131203/14674_1 /TAXON_ID=753684 ORGANISM="Madagascaria erythrocladiodes, Strain CCMP3234" /NCGR_SAMPLE_ID=MMETSP1450 /ASSEMBLY_ACC=CAM_ASM_001115 /LENGTH=150 /DNA_ID=CAMNT_0044031445 /DNA_START=37 /DNA_END=486 /DNA_ORIENTATION=+